jgi:ABC-type nitrate/sulfonate/bicarbonate transport system permease component
MTSSTAIATPSAWGINLTKVGAILLLAIAWELFPHLGILTANTFPPLSKAVATIFTDHTFARHALTSIGRAYGGLTLAVLVGLPLGLLLGGWFNRLQQALEPLMELFGQANPVILSHIVVLFFGIGTGTQLFVISWLSIWPISFSAINGVRSVDPQILKMAASLGLGRWELFTRIILPSAAPAIITGLRLSAGYAFIMLIAAELMGATTGLGYVMATSAETGDMTSLAAAALIITVLAFATDQILKQAGQRIVVWRYQGGVD